MTEAWTIKDANGRLAPSFVGYTKFEVEMKVITTHYDPQALLHDAYYRSLFDEELKNELSDRGYTIVKINLVESGVAPIPPGWWVAGYQ